ncbi:hypothetical protein B0H13DRAFT_2650255 [Mycena leptocephala]|nr:hypothetical protein B0H13DRAFT_2650255 [Mycena leptocephala]
MHRCLQIHEMVDLIVSHLHLSSGALALLARTCTIFHNPALNILWREQYGLDNLLRCMPSGLFVVEGGVWRLQRPILPTDWNRALQYMQRVKEFHSPWFDNAHGSDILPVLTMCLPGDCLFPNLRTLQWSHADDNHFHHIHIFLNRQLSRIVILSKTPLPQLSILSMLPRKCPSLKSVSIHLPPRNLPTEPSIQASISAFAQQLNQIEFLHMPLLDVAAVRHVAELPTLHSLELRMVPMTLQSLPLDTSFINLRHLALLDVNVDSASHFLSSCANAALVSLAVNVAARPRPGALDLFITALAQCTCSHSTLTSLTLDLSLPDGSPITPQSLCPLFCFKELSHVDIKSEAGFDLDDSFILEMTHVWRHLKNLQFREDVPCIPLGVTLECLRIFSGNCPDLRTLHLSFDASTLHTSQGEKNCVAQTMVGALDVAYSHISTPSFIAGFISTVFPNLRHISTAMEYSDFAYQNVDEQELDEDEQLVFHRRWKEVQCRLGGIRREGGL